MHGKTLIFFSSYKPLQLFEDQQASTERTKRKRRLSRTADDSNDDEEESVFARLKAQMVRQGSVIDLT